MRSVVNNMSRIGKKEILIPDKVEVTQSNGVVKVKGPLGETERYFKPDIEIMIGDKSINLKPKKTPENNALWGSYASHITNMIEGVTKGFEKKLVIEGVGFKAQVSGKKLSLNLGLSHPVEVEVPVDINVLVDKNLITISGVDKERVGQFSATVRAIKKPEPYKGTGIRYEKEFIIRKVGKKAATAAT